MSDDPPRTGWRFNTLPPSPTFRGCEVRPGPKRTPEPEPEPAPTFTLAEILADAGLEPPEGE